MPSRIDELNRGFRDRFLDYEELGEQLRAWAEAFPSVVQRSSLGTTPEGRELWMLTIGPEPERTRPSVWIDGNMHATELCGSSVALAIAEDVIGLHLGQTPHGMSEAALERLREVRFFVMPRMSPDGAEQVLSTGRYVRSTPRDTRPERQHARWITGDVNGDGLALIMRVQDPTGEFVESSDAPGLMLPRRLDDGGPFYKIYPEGLIENWDGSAVPTPSMLSDNHVDLNRNFPFGWAPEPKQMGAGHFPGSEPESRAVIAFATAHPEIFAWLNLHTFGGVFIRPLGDKPDTKMDPEDLALFRQIGEWAEELTGYPMVSGFEQFTYEPETPLYGDLTEYAYHQRGCIAYVVELWDVFEQIGAAKQERFVDRYTHFSRDDALRLWRWDAEHNQSRLFPPWRPFEHPQLGPVEIGGLDPRVGLSNPPLERIGEICGQHSAHFLRVAAMTPSLHVELDVEPLGESASLVTVQVENRGYLGTQFLSSAAKLTLNEAPGLTVTCSGCQLVDLGDSRVELGHLDGWGRGLYAGGSAVFSLRSRGSTGRRVHRFAVTGHGKLQLRIGSCRIGWLERHLDV